MPSVSIVAIVAAFNEADVIAHVVGDLIEQGVQVYFLDDGSTDGTVAAVEPYVGRGVIAIERMAPAGGSGAPFDWERILRRKAQLARELDAGWFIHHDADEFRESPWPHLTLAAAIGRVDAMGYNAIDFASLNFWPVHDRFEPGGDVRQAFAYYSEQAPYDRVQIRCWKKADDVDLASTGGHEARFAGRKVFPLRFILRHYPVRGQAHGERKVFAERRGRFRDEERARGWHVQYDEFAEGARFVQDASALHEYDRDTVAVELALRHRGVEELESALTDTRSALTDERSTLSDTRSALARTQSDLDQTQSALGDARASIIRLHHDLDTTAQELESRRQELDAHRRELAARRQELDRAAAALTASYVQSTALGQQVDARMADLGRATADLETRRVHIERLDADLETRRVQANALEAELERRRRHINTLDADLETRRQQVETFDAEFEVLANVLRLRDIEIRNWKRSLDDAIRRLHAFQDSRTWRWTAPLRAAYRVITKRRHDS